jgi:selenocysteine lyase/cysteine desulfurase
MKFPFAKNKVVIEGVDTIPFESFFQELRQKEYARLDETGNTYLDYTGGNLYAKSQLDKHQRMLRDNVFGNPHSTNPTSLASTLLVAEARNAVLRFFNAEDDYHCIFTPNASGALRIVGESYPFSTNSRYLLLTDNHNSVNGIREYCRNKGGKFEYGYLKASDLNIDDDKLNEQLNEGTESETKLFAFPAQSNVSGIKHDLSWIEKAHKKGWDVLLDAAAFVPTSKLDLSLIKPDFVSLSFYKMFGYPTGLGCLLIKKSKFDKLQKPWFAGGTVQMVGVKDQKHWLVNDHERFEDGTINYLDIPAIKIGLDYLETIGMHRITERISALSETLYRELSALQHENGAPILQIYGPKNRKNVGGTLIMNFLDKDGNIFPIEQVEKKANERKISIRTGCFCNPGLDELNSGISTDELSKYFTDHEDGNFGDRTNFYGKLRGATRISVGLATNKEDIQKFIDFVKSFENRALHN